MLVIYDQTGRIYFRGTGFGVPEDIFSMDVTIPKGQYVSSISISDDGIHTPIFSQFPKSNLQKLEEVNLQQQADIDYIMLLLE